jgi:site-specific recombinase XerC
VWKFQPSFSEGQLRVPGKGSKLRFLPLAPETTQLIDHYLRLERPDPCSAALFVVLKGPARGTRMTPAGLRSLFRYHRRTTGIQLANPHRFSSDNERNRDVTTAIPTSVPIGKDCPNASK